MKSIMCSLTLVLPKPYFTSVLSQPSIGQYNLMTTYASFPLLKPQPLQTLSIYIKFNFQNSIATWWSMNTLPLSNSLLHDTFLGFLHKYRFQLDMIIILFNGWNTTFHSLTLLNFSYSYYSSLFKQVNVNFEDDCLGNAYVNSFVTHILDTKYEQVNIHDVASDQEHLSLDQQKDLFNILSKHKNLCNGSFWVYPQMKVHIDLKPGAKPGHYCTYPVPHIHRQTFKKNLNHMVKLGILEPCGASEWALPAFIIPKNGWMALTDYGLMLP